MRLCIILIFVTLLNFSCAEPTYETIDGILEVPENRDKPNSRTLNLVYKVLKAKDTTTGKAPIVFLMGGPGGETLFTEEMWKNHPFRNERDIVLMDQRGTGASEANCAEFGEEMFEIMMQDLDQKEEERALDSIMGICMSTMHNNKVDLAGYNSRENAADFEDLRVALGYKKWNLYGASYGTRLGLTIMRDFPNSVRSAIFIGVFPPESQLFGELVGSFEKSLFEVLRRCEQNENCNNKYPNLKKRLLNTLKKLQSEPLHFDYNSKEFVLNRRDALLLIHQALYSRYSVAYMPKIIDALENEEPELFINALQRVEFIYKLINWPMNNSVMAYEELPFIDSLKVVKYMEESKLEFDITSFEGFTSLSNLHPFRASSLENQPVVSEIPTLLISGGLDPVTPPSNAKRALKHLKNGYEVIFFDESHEMFNPCFLEIARDFLNIPSQKPNIECSSIRKPIEWSLN
ncbi:alpha/beta hydrolase [Aurantibacter crassamenti]|uniref:alpha/beta fold hydrolase n=1 Tax=Aurantibacter crassamenti TaxID=1837375 RepID=UPI00193A5049|nr:alpha/beta hydrolase [Aurantibacter crassamenti]MBM1104931.1 alpha/beta hydrolase [Aurantibacter crassamenti]